MAHIDILIVTALSDELDAVLAIGDGGRGRWHERKDGDGFPYFERQLPRDNGTLHVAAAWAGGMGETTAASRSTALIRELRPSCIAMCGICAGRRGEVSLGDVIVADRVYSYDHGKLIADENGRETEFFHDIETYNLSKRWKMLAELFEPNAEAKKSWAGARPRTKTSQKQWLLHALYAQQFERKPAPHLHPERQARCPGWSTIVLELRQERLIKSGRAETLALTKKGIRQVIEERILHPDGLPGDLPFRVHVGSIATGKTVREDSTLFDRLRHLVRKTIGVEMEAAAIGLVAEHFQLDSIIVKSVSDHADHEKDDSFRKFACRVSAEWLLEFLQRYYESPIPHTPSGSFPHGDVPAVPAANERISVNIAAALANQLDQLMSQLSEQTSNQLEQTRSAFREGRYQEAADWVAKTKSNPIVWPSLPSGVRAKILRFEASLSLYSSDDVEHACLLADEARAIAPDEDETRLRALIAHAEGRMDDALALLYARTDRESRELLAGMLIELDRLVEAAKILNSDEVKNGPEGMRLKAYLLLLDGRLSEARLEVQKALHIEPGWVSLRFLEAIVSYCSALSPAALLSCIPPRPEPVPLIAVRSDVESIQRLQDAACIFSELTQKAQLEDQRHLLEGWHLACLLNDPTKQKEAVAFCSELLQREPGHHLAVRWAVQRGLEIDLGPSIVMLEQQISADNSKISSVLALVVCRLSDGDVTRAQDLLEQTKSLFETNERFGAWHVWRAHVLIASGQAQQAYVLAKDLHEARAAQSIKTMALCALAKESSEALEQAIVHLEKRFAETNDAGYLIDACSLMAEHERWAYVADRAMLLVETAQTVDVLRLAMRCAHNAHRFEFCLRLLERYRELIPNWHMPADLKRIRVRCLAYVGALLEAIGEAEDLIKDLPTVENQWQLIELLVQVGDLRKAALHARDLERHPDVHAAQALQLSRWLQNDDRLTAIRLWHRAQELGVSDEKVALAFDLAIQLGLERHAHGLFQRIQLLANQEQFGVQTHSVDDLVKLMTQNYESAKHADALYRSGAPIHGYIAQSKEPLVIRYHHLLEENLNAPDPIRQDYLLIRHGRRPMPPLSAEKPRLRIGLDTTAVLLAAHFDVLSAVEKAFKPLWLPPSLIAALQEMRQQLLASQLRKKAEYRRIVELVDSGRLKVVNLVKPLQPFEQEPVNHLGEQWLALFERARSQHGYLVDFLPVSERGLSTEPAVLPANAENVLASCWSIVESLKQHELIPNAGYLDALKALGSIGRVRLGTFPEKGKAVYCKANTPEVLIDAGVMDVMVEHFEMYIEHEELERARTMLRVDGRRRQLGEWLERLCERLRCGLEKKTYEILPIVPDLAKKLRRFAGAPLAMQCFFELIEVQSTDLTEVWVDDRYMQAFERLPVARIVGILEILAALVSAGELSQEEYFDRVLQLRAANIRFLPLGKEEVLHHLRRAKLESGELIESYELGVLRRAFAAVLLKANDLQRSSSNDDLGELTLLRDSAEAVVSAVISIWEDQDELSAQARADWLVRAMYVEPLGLTWMLGVNSAVDRRFLAAFEAFRFLGGTGKFDGSSRKEAVSKRKRYFDWVFDRLFATRCEADRSLLSAIGDVIKAAMREALGLQQQEEEELFAYKQFWAFQFVDDLPDLLSKEIKRDADFLAEIGVTEKWLVTVAGLHFSPGEFWGAAASAMQEGESSIYSRNGKRFKVVRKQKGEPFEFEIVGRLGKRYDLSDPRLELLAENPSVREAVLLRHREWLDVPDEMLHWVAAEIASTEDPAARMAKLEKWGASNVANYYLALREKILTERAFKASDLLPPDAEGLLRHNRFSLERFGMQFKDALEGAAQALAKEEGVIQALMRLSGLPVPLPNPILDAVRALSVKERRQVIRSFSREVQSPVATIHLIRLLREFRAENAAYARWAVLLAKRILRRGQNQAFEAFRCVLVWVSSAFMRWPDVREWPDHIKLMLVWLHAHRLYTLFKGIGTADDWLAKKFGDSRPWAMSVLWSENTYSQDAACPERLAWLPFTISGLAYALEGGGADFEGVRGIIRGLVFPDQKDDLEWVPELAFLREVSLGHNSMGAFLAGDRERQLSGLLEPELAAMFRSQSLQEYAAKLVDQLLAGGAQELWWPLEHIVDSRPIYPELSQKMKNLLCSVDIVGSLEKNCMVALLALRVGTEQAVFLGDEATRRHLRGEWLGIVDGLFRGSQPEGRVAYKDISIDYERVVEFVIHAAWNLARMSSLADTNDAKAGELAGLLSRLVEHPYLCTSVTLRKVIEAFCYGLFPTESRYFWPLLVKLRALRVDRTGPHEPPPDFAPQGHGGRGIDDIRRDDDAISTIKGRSRKGRRRRGKRRPKRV